MNIKKRLLRTLIIVAAGLSIGAVFGLVQLSMTQNAQVENKGLRDVTPDERRAMAGINLGGPFALTDHTGQTVTDQDYANSYKFMYFGFTYCPAICPTELQRMAQVMNALDEAQQEQIEMLFVSVDPARDTVPVMADYVSLFHPELIGLTGSQEQVDGIMKNYRIFATQVPINDGEDYTVDHSSFLYFMSPQNEPLAVFRMKDSVEYMISEIQRAVGASETAL